MITGAAYDTVNHILLIQKLCDFTQAIPLCRVIQNMLSIRRFYVELNKDRSRWINQNSLPHGNVLSQILFNIYTNDQPLHDGTRNFIYADDLCVTAQYPSITEVEHTIEEVLVELTTYYRSNSLRANKQHTHTTKMKVATRINLLKKLSNSKWGVISTCFQTGS